MTTIKLTNSLLDESNAIAADAVRERVIRNSTRNEIGKMTHDQICMVAAQMVNLIPITELIKILEISEVKKVCGGITEINVKFKEVKTNNI